MSIPHRMARTQKDGGSRDPKVDSQSKSDGTLAERVRAEEHKGWVNHRVYRKGQKQARTPLELEDGDEQPINSLTFEFALE